MKEPLVTVVIPFHNEEKYIKNAVMSIVNQTYKNLEILLVDDASNDNSKNIIKSISDNRIRIIELMKNMGEAYARNIGIDNARGEYIAMQDADDESDLTRIEKQLNTLLKNGINTVCGTSVIIKTPQKEIKKILPIKHKDIIKGFERKFNRVTFVAGTLMCKTNILREFKYRVQFKYFLDWDLLLRLYESNRFTFCNLEEPLYTYIIRIKSTRYRPDWFDYNIFVRDCQRRRKLGLEEFANLEQFINYLEDNIHKNIYYKLLKLMIKINKKIQGY